MNKTQAAIKTAAYPPSQVLAYYLWLNEGFTADNFERNKVAFTKDTPDPVMNGVYNTLRDIDNGLVNRRLVEAVRVAYGL